MCYIAGFNTIIVKLITRKVYILVPTDSITSSVNLYLFKQTLSDDKGLKRFPFIKKGFYIVNLLLPVFKAH